jgi:TPR repeat protein
MKFNRAVGTLLLILAGFAMPACGQPTDAERKEFDAVKARADKGDPEAQLSVASRYANGQGVAMNPAKSAKWLRKAAEQGSARAQCLLGLAYANGDGVKLNKAEAAVWLRRSAEQGLAEAQFDLGMCYANGDGVRRSAAEAASWYRKAADQALPDAECELGNCYLEGAGVPKDIPEGIKWTRRAANQGFPRAQYILGQCYAKGTGVPKDYVQAYKWLNLAGSAGGLLADDARVSLAAAERYLKPEQVAEGQRLASEFKPKKGPPAEESAAPQAKAEPQPSDSGPGPAAAGQPSTVSVEASKPGLLNVKAEDDSYEIYVDGGFVGNAPARVKVGEGAHVVEVKKPGYKDYRKQITITEGSELTLRAVLEKQ